MLPSRRFLVRTAVTAVAAYTLVSLYQWLTTEDDEEDDDDGGRNVQKRDPSLVPIIQAGAPMVAKDIPPRLRAKKKRPSFSITD